MVNEAADKVLKDEASGDDTEFKKELKANRCIFYKNMKQRTVWMKSKA